MLSRTKAVAALQDGCSRLGLPSSTATALVQFLSVKRTHDQFVGDEARQLRMSPGFTLDKLWHFMLLNTAVSSLVHDLLGGVVEHRGIDSTDLPDDTKLLQRLYALNILRLEGHEPDVALWTEPGTALHTLHLTASPVPALQHLPGGGRLYVTPTLTQQQQGQLVRALQLLYAEDEVTCDSNVQLVHGERPQAQPIAAAAAAAAGAAALVSAAAAAGSAQPAKRPAPDSKRQEMIDRILAERQRLKRLEQYNNGGAVLHLTVKDQLGAELQVKVKPTTPMWRIMEAVEAQNGLEPDVYKLFFDGERMSSQDTPGDLGMVDGDCIDLIMVQCGC